MSTAHGRLNQGAVGEPVEGLLPAPEVKNEVDDWDDEREQNAPGTASALVEWGKEKPIPGFDTQESVEAVGSVNRIDALIETLRENEGLSFEDYKNLMRSALDETDMVKMSYDLFSSKSLDVEQRASTAIVLYKMAQMHGQVKVEQSGRKRKKITSNSPAMRCIAEIYTIKIGDVVDEDWWLIAMPPFRNVNIKASIYSVIIKRKKMSSKSLLTELGLVIRHIFSQYVPYGYDGKIAYTPNKISTGMDQFPTCLADQLIRVLGMCVQLRDEEEDNGSAPLEWDELYSSVHQKIYETTVNGPNRVKVPNWFPLKESEYISSLSLAGVQPLEAQHTSEIGTK